MANAIQTAVMDEALEPMPIHQEDILAGAPQASGRVLFTDRGNGTCSGIWQCTPGRFDWAYDANETVSILAGRATVECDDGTAVELGPGSYALFRKGARARWTVHETVRKVFVLH